MAIATFHFGTALISSVAAAPPTLSHFYPTGTQRGRAVDVVAGGKFPVWPVNVWCDTDGVKFHPTEKQGHFRVSVDESADVGVCHVRVFDQAGASKLVPFVVGTQSEGQETEPNGTLADANEVRDATIINGRLGTRGDVDSFRVNVKQGQTLVADLDANFRLGSPMDAVLQLVDSKGFVVADNHDARGLDPAIVFMAPADSTLIVRVFAFPSQPNSTVGFSGGDDYIYRLTLTTGPVLSHVLPLATQTAEEENLRPVGWNLNAPLPALDRSTERSRGVTYFSDGVAGDFRVDVAEIPPSRSGVTPSDMPITIDIPASISATISKPGEAHTYQLSVQKGDAFTLAVKSDVFGFPLDAVLKIVDDAGKVLSRTDDTNKKRDPTVSVTAPATGSIKVIVSDLYQRGGMRFAYRLDVAATQPDFELELSDDSFLGNQKIPAEVKVTVTRTNNHREPIEVTAVDLPEGWTAAPVKSERGKGKTESVTVKLTPKPDAQAGPFSVVGVAGDRKRVATFVVERDLSSHPSAWVTRSPDDEK